MPKSRVTLFIQHTPDTGAKEFRATVRGDLGTATVRVCVETGNLPEIDDLDFAHEIAAEAKRLTDEFGPVCLEPGSPVGKEPSGPPMVYYGDGILFTVPGMSHTKVPPPRPRWLR